MQPWDGEAQAWSLLGALVAALEREASTRGEMPLDELAAALYALADLIDTDSLVAWNDAPGRTAAEILAALDGAAREYDEPWQSAGVSWN